MPQRKLNLNSGDKFPVQHREYKIDKAKIDAEKRTVEILFSTDDPAERWFGDEILDHSPGACDLRRLNDGGAFLKDHNPSLQIGVHESASISFAAVGTKQRGEGRAVVRFAPTTNELAEQEFQDMMAGVRTKISVGYVAREMKLVEEDEDGNETWLVTKWEPLENSLVAIPLDPNCAAGRAGGKEEFPIVIDASFRNREKNSQKREKDVDTEGNRIEKRRNAGQLETRKNMTPEEQAAADEKARKQREADEREEARERNEKVLDGVKAAREREKEINDIAARASVPEDKKGEFERALERAIEKAVTDEAAVADFQTYVFKNFWGNAKPIDTPSGQGNGDLQVGTGKRNLTVGETFMQSKEVKALGGRLERGKGVGVEIPNLSTIGIRGKVALAQRAGFTSSDLSAVNVTIAPGIIALGVQRLTIMDVIGSGSIGTGSYKYAQENSFGTVDGVAVANASGGAPGMPRAKAVGERGLKPNWEPDLTTQTANVSKVAVTTKVPDEFLADFSSAMSYIDDRLPLMVDTETEYQILYGDGLNNNLKGIFTFAGVQTRAILNTDDSTKAASVRQGLTDIQVGAMFEPDFIGFHPYDWETAQLLKDSTGRFLAGGPYYIPYTAGVYLEVHTFWGKRVVVSTAISYGRPIAGAGKIGAAALMREGMRIEMTNSNEDDFKRNLMCLRAEHRLALPVYRPVAFIEFTGWPARA